MTTASPFLLNLQKNGTSRSVDILIIFSYVSMMHCAFPSRDAPFSALRINTRASERFRAAKKSNEFMVAASPVTMIHPKRPISFTHTGSGVFGSVKYSSWSTTLIPASTIKSRNVRPPEFLSMNRVGLCGKSVMPADCLHYLLWRDSIVLSYIGHFLPSAVACGKRIRSNSKSSDAEVSVVN